MHARFFAIPALAALIAACATATPYAPVGTPGAGQYGYSDQKLEDTRFRVTFSGNSLTKLRTVENYVLFRAAELTLEQGADWFRVVQRQQDADRRLRGTGSSFGYGYSAFDYRFFHPRYGAFGYRDPFFTDINVDEVTRYEVSAEIVIGSGAKPADPQAYAAQEVVDNLGGFVTRPEPQDAA